MTDVVLPITDIALTTQEVFPYSRLLEFLSRGSVEAATHKIFRLLGEKLIKNGLNTLGQMTLSLKTGEKHLPFQR